MVKFVFKLILLILLFGFISISPKNKIHFGNIFKTNFFVFLWTVKYEEREKWIIEKPSWIPSQKPKSSS